MLPKLNICEKKRNNLENFLHNKIFGFCQRKKKQAPFSKRFVSNILCPKNKKNFYENFLLKKQVLTCLVYKKKKKKKKQSLYLQSFDLNDKTLLILFCSRQSLLMAKNKTENTLEKKQRFFCFVFFRVVFSSKFSK